MKNSVLNINSQLKEDNEVINTLKYNLHNFILVLKNFYYF